MKLEKLALALTLLYIMAIQLYTLARIDSVKVILHFDKKLRSTAHWDKKTYRRDYPECLDIHYDFPGKNKNLCYVVKPLTTKEK